MTIKDLQNVFDKYQPVNIFDGTNLLYYNDVMCYIPQELECRKIRTTIIGIYNVNIYLEGECD